MSNKLLIIDKNIKKYQNELCFSKDNLSKLAGVALYILTKIETGATVCLQNLNFKGDYKGLNVSANTLIKN